MDATKVRRFREQIQRFRQRFGQGCAGALGNLLGQAELERWLPCIARDVATASIRR
jgi:hypothetical protein